MASAVARWANDQRKDALAGEIVATADSLAKENPDQSLLLALAARTVSTIPKADAFIRFARATYVYRSVLRGHENPVTSAQFSPDGKIVATISMDGTARLWLCRVCRPADEIAAELTNSIGRELSEEEQRRFGLQNVKSLSLSPLFSR